MATNKKAGIIGILSVITIIIIATVLILNLPSDSDPTVNSGDTSTAQGESSSRSRKPKRADSSSTSSESSSSKPVANTTKKPTPKPPVIPPVTKPANNGGSNIINNVVEFKITVTASGNGSVSGGGTFKKNTKTTLEATPDDGNTFDGWYLNGEMVSTDNSYEIKVTTNAEYVAEFVEEVVEVKKGEISVSTPGNGTVTGGGSFEIGSSVTLVATANTGYNFDGWYLNDTKVSSDASYTFNVTSHAQYVAKFVEVEAQKHPEVIDPPAFTEEQKKQSPHLTQPDKSSGKKDLTAGSTAISAHPGLYDSTINACLNNDPNNESRWGMNDPDVGELVAEITFAKPSNVEYVGLTQYIGNVGAQGGPWSSSIEKITFELADEVSPYVVVATGNTTENYKNTNASPNFWLNNIAKKFDKPIKAQRMRVTIKFNDYGNIKGINIKNICAFGTESTSATPTPEMKELKNTIEVALSRNPANYTTESIATMNKTLKYSREVYFDKKNIIKGEAVEYNQKLIDDVYTLEKKVKPNSKIKIAFVGDSITFGAGFALDTQTQKSFPALIGNKIGSRSIESDYIVKNFGQSGRTLMTSGDSPYITGKQYKPSLDFAPDVVSIMLGTNDSKGINFDNGKINNYKSDARKMINSYKLLESQPIIYFNTSPMVLDLVDRPNDPTMIYNKNIIEVAKIQREIPKENKHINQIDINQLTQTFTKDDFVTEDQVNIGTDGIHPGAKGHAKLATIFENSFRSTKEFAITDSRVYLNKMSYVDESIIKSSPLTQFKDIKSKLTAEINNDKSTAATLNAAKKALEAVYTTLKGANLDSTKARIACVGDSLTEGGYPALLQAKINAGGLTNKYTISGNKDGRTGGFGYSGSSLRTNSGNSYTQSEQYLKSIGSLPNIVIIMLGTNDGSGNANADYAWMTQAFTDVINGYKNLPTEPKIVLATCPTAFAKGGISQDLVNNINIKIVAKQKELATSLTLPIIDINDATKNSGSLVGDGFHYGNYQIFADTFYSGLKSNGIIS